MLHALQFVIFVHKDYQCGYPSNWSITYQMKTIGNSSNYSPQFLVYGDFGYDNAQSMSLIKRHVNGFQGTVDAILHVGDLAYDLFSVSQPASEVCNYNLSLVLFIDTIQSIAFIFLIRHCKIIIVYW